MWCTVNLCVSICIWCSAKVLFTCVQVLGRQQAKKGLSVKCATLEQTARYWVGQSKQEYTWGKRSGKRFSLTLDRGHEGRIRKVLQEDSCSSIYRDIATQLSAWKELAWNERIVFVLPWLLCNTIVSYHWVKRSIDFYCSHCHDYLQYIIVSNYWAKRSIDYDRFSLPWLSYDAPFASYYELSALLIVVYFLRLKINHESHEFILESGTVANMNY